MLAKKIMLKLEIDCDEYLGKVLKVMKLNELIYIAVILIFL